MLDIQEYSFRRMSGSGKSEVIIRQNNQMCQKDVRVYNSPKKTFY